MTKENQHSFTVTEPLAETQIPISANKRLVKAAGILAIGNIASRILGLVREMVKAYLFGASGLLSAYETAVLVPNSLNELIIGGMVNSALVPVFSEYASEEKREELWGLVSTFLSMATIVLVVLIGLVEVFAPTAATLVGAFNFADVTLSASSIQLMRLATPAVFFLSISSVLSGLLYALKRFTLPAFTSFIFNGTIVTVALLRPEHVSSLVWGMLLGSVFQVIWQLPALRDTSIRWQLQWRHPALRRIVWLYLPILASIGINQIAIGFAYNLANRTGDESLTYMRYATTLYQFPLGLVVTALSIATLPTLSQQAQGQLAAFKQTLAEGVRLVIALIIPAAVGLVALAPLLITLLFQRGQFTAADTEQTARVLRVFMIGLPFAAVDQMLIFALYARKDTWRPATIGVISIVVYSGVAWWLLAPLGLLSLMVADAIKHMVHTVLMLVILHRQLKGIGGYGVVLLTGKVLLASAVMGVLAYGVATTLPAFLPLPTLLTQIVTIGLAGMVGGGVYLLLARLLSIRDIQLLIRLFKR